MILGNSGSGKTTLARRRAESTGSAFLSLDSVAWVEGTTRRPLPESVDLFREFARPHDRWVAEGCYGDLVESVLAPDVELWLLNPGIDVCVENCLRRPWEPDKFGTRAEQDAMLEHLIAWVRQYETRDDEFGAVRHREIFERHVGRKREFRALGEYPP
ncbi:MAG: shikimate kinase [Planctomycetes bacterium]|nr:shikimate kinase [Planctomycetota bacterium]